MGERGLYMGVRGLRWAKVPVIPFWAVFPSFLIGVRWRRWSFRLREHTTNIKKKENEKKGKEKMQTLQHTAICMTQMRLEIKQQQDRGTGVWWHTLKFVPFLNYYNGL